MKNYIDNGDGSDFKCGTRVETPCLYWEQPAYQSRVLYGYLDPSISNVGSNHYDFRPDINAAFADFNAVQAFNPFFYSCTYPTTCGHADYYATSVPPCYAAITINYTNGGVYWDANVRQYWSLITRSEVRIDNRTALSWNQTHYSTCNPGNGGIGTYDGRTTVAHETGHVQALGHTRIAGRLMQAGPGMWPCQCHVLQQDDKLGLQAIYPGYYPA